MAAMSKYLIWVTDIKGEYILADEIQDDGITVLFLRNGQVVRKEKLKDIEGYSKVEE